MVYLVSGLYRSGTKMVMECLETGGMTVVKSDHRDRYNDVHSDELYAPNKGGLYEVSMREMRTFGFPCQHDGKAIKVVVPFLHFLAVHDYEVIFMHRNSEEIRQSAEASFKIRKTVDEIIRETYEGLNSLRNRRDVHKIVEWNYRDVLADPLRHFESLGWPLDAQKAASVVDPNLCRFRLEKLEVGL